MQTTWLHSTDRLPHLPPAMAKLISWNLLRLTGASLDDVVRLEDVYGREGTDTP